ncbi:MAG: hypothetical protein R2764_23025 [Bacteroidales bacterium]
MGPLYNPSNPDIALDALTNIKTSSNEVMAGVVSATVPFKTAVNSREEGYEGMSNIAVRAFNALASCGAEDEIIKDAKGIVNKITGRRTGKKKPIDPENPEPETISTSQMGFDNRKANFEMLVALLKGEPKYNPNEADLQPAQLEAYVTSLGPLNDAVNTTLAAVQSKRTERNEVLYGPSAGMSDIATKVKAYVKSVVGASSPVYKEIAAIKIRKPSYL